MEGSVEHHDGKREHVCSVLRLYGSGLVVAVVL